MKTLVLQNTAAKVRRPAMTVAPIGTPQTLMAQPYGRLPKRAQVALALVAVAVLVGLPGAPAVVLGPLEVLSGTVIMTATHGMDLLQIKAQTPGLVHPKILVVNSGVVSPMTMLML